ncbi:MAG: NAD(P)H-dependent oxidoreductase subunit E [Elusimicrobiota bacterium]|jgi:NADH:ubiquinone oxidoreductase subunit F (NADH-binding)/NADH:ubiquinone oxidoreductase subunit E
MTHLPFTPEEKASIESWTRRYPEPVMGLVEALREIQKIAGCVSPEDEAYAASVFGVPLDQIRAVVSFYPFFNTRAPAKHHICVCRNLSCSRKGAARLAEQLREKLGVGPKEATADGLFRWEPVECLGACDHAPAISVDDELLEAGSEAVLDAALADLRAGRAPKPAELGIHAPPEDGRPRLLTRHFGDPGLHRFEVYRRFGGYAAAEKSAAVSPSEIIAQVKKSNLRGLGGAGFPAGMKWETVPPKSARQAPHYLVANADESEPGCYKDRVLLERNPHALIEGLLIAARAVEADGIFVFMRGEYARPKRILEAALAEARENKVLDRDILVLQGANAYISGCDTALLETISGRKAYPRQPPPFPTVEGLFGAPTVVNNVETLMMLGPLLQGGAEAFARTGVEKSGGTAVYSVSGDVERPGIYELPMGAAFTELLSACGGVRGGRKLKAVFPGGTSTPVLSAQEALGLRLDFESPRAARSFLGAGGVVVLDETADMVEVLHVIERFLWHESCGQCTPCREGSGWVERILRRMLDGQGMPQDPANLLRIGENITGRVICALGDSVGMAAKSLVEKFPGDFARRSARRSDG